MGEMGIGVQLFSVRKQLEADFTGTLKRVAEAGYEGVEFAGNFGGLPADQLLALLNDLGLKPIGDHPGIYALRDKLAQTVTYLRELGAPFAVAPWLPEEYRSAEAFPGLLAILAQAGQAFHEAGIVFGYHNHDFEFNVKIDGEYLLDTLFARTSPAQVAVELDVGWVHYAGEDPAAYIAKYSGRIPLVHLKDFARTAAGGWQTAPVGKGSTPIADVIRAAGQAGSQWLIVEQDETTGDIFDDITESRQWLRQQYR